MICHEFKGGIGTASRVAPTAAGRSASWSRRTTGARAAAHRRRAGRRGDPSRRGRIAVGGRSDRGARAAGAGSIIGIVATDAPLLPHQCARLARRAASGSRGSAATPRSASGDIFLAFATGNRGLPRDRGEDAHGRRSALRMVVAGRRPALRGDRGGDRGGDRRMPWSPPRRWSGATGSPPVHCPTIGWSRSCARTPRTRMGCTSLDVGRLCGQRPSGIAVRRTLVPYPTYLR